jgi:hypothetical protein
MAENDRTQVTPIRLSTEQAELIPMDARLGAPGRPQSATDQTAILTGTFTPRNPSA